MSEYVLLSKLIENEMSTRTNINRPCDIYVKEGTENSPLLFNPYFQSKACLTCGELLTSSIPLSEKTDGSDFELFPNLHLCQFTNRDRFVTFGKDWLLTTIWEEVHLQVEFIPNAVATEADRGVFVTSQKNIVARWQCQVCGVIRDKYAPGWTVRDSGTHDCEAPCAVCTLHDEYYVGEVLRQKLGFVTFNETFTKFLSNEEKR
jgi:hypothetical protein